MRLCLLSSYLCRLSVAEGYAGSLSGVHFSLGSSLWITSRRLVSVCSHVAASVERRRRGVSWVISLHLSWHIWASVTRPGCVACRLSALSIVESLDWLLLSLSLGQKRCSGVGVECSRSITRSGDLRLFNDDRLGSNPSLVVDWGLRVVKVARTALGCGHLTVAEEAGSAWLVLGSGRGCLLLHCSTQVGGGGIVGCCISLCVSFSCDVLNLRLPRGSGRLLHLGGGDLTSWKPKGRWVPRAAHVLRGGGVAGAVVSLASSVSLAAALDDGGQTVGWATFSTMLVVVATNHLH